ncbi:hypothetical protein Tco_0799102, partial [Tanacetum coccineum]
YAFSDSLLLTPLCCDDINDVTPRVSALVGCDRYYMVTEHLMAQSGTDLKMAKLVISSPNHPTSDIEDAFSSNFPDYIPASPV